MSGAGARLNVFPTRQNLQVMKVKLVGAKKGHSLLKKKADALTMRLRLLLRSILKAKEDMGSAFREGNFALAEVKYAAGDIKPTVIESVGVAQKKVEIRVDNIAGVKVPVFKVRPPPHPRPSSPSLAAGECAPWRRAPPRRAAPVCHLLPPPPLLTTLTGGRRCGWGCRPHGAVQGRAADRQGTDSLLEGGRRTRPARHPADLLCHPR
jgi:hypothetical protein